MKIHAIETGKVKITRKWRVGQGGRLRRLANTLLDNEFTDWLPIYVWVIEHPEGLIVIDTGIPADANRRFWFPPFMPLVQRAAVFDMSPELEVGPQLRQLGIDPDDVRWVVLTHLHQDHDGGLRYFPKAEIVVARDELAAASGLMGRMGGYLNQRWPDWFLPRRLDFDLGPYRSFPHHARLTQAGDVVLVPTPGHSAGHLSVILEENERSIFFAGDAAYTDELLIADTIDGVGPDAEAQHATHRRIQAYARQRPTVFLPTHDPRSEIRLRNRTQLGPEGITVEAVGRDARVEQFGSIRP